MDDDVRVSFFDPKIGDDQKWKLERPKLEIQKFTKNNKPWDLSRTKIS